MVLSLPCHRYSGTASRPTKTRRSSLTSFRRRASVSQFFREEPRYSHCLAVRFSPRNRGNTPRQHSRAGNEPSLLLQAARIGGNARASGESSPINTRRKAARVVVRRAKERDYRGVAEIRGVIIPVGMSGATGFLGNKVVIDSPEEAERRLLMAKVGGINHEDRALRATAVCRFAFRGCGASFLGNVNIWSSKVKGGSSVSSRHAPSSFRRRCAVRKRRHA